MERNNMKKDNTYWHWGLSACIALGLFGILLYPPIMRMRPSFVAIYFYMIAGGITFLAGCWILQKFKEFSFWKLAVYHALVVAPGTVISGITTILSHPTNFFTARDNFFIFRPDPLLFLSFCAFVLFVSLNVLSWRMLFNITFRQAFLTGAIMGLLNTITYLAITIV
jgi:hypothetical protein